MEEVRKWRVTYTTHVRQKRKVYHEGFLHLQSNNKVLVYDDCEKLLDSKYLKTDEGVKPGESMAFSSCLVDIGDPESSSSCILLPNRESESDSRTPEKPRFQYEGKSRNSFPNKRPSTWSKKTSANNLSPSQKIIREFKKNEIVKYSTHHSPSSVAMSSSSKEWEALYTTQITQKAKKYHDGFIRLIICGSQARQVALYDSSKTQIDKRFLKKDELICAGESLKFDGHLVDIGDASGDNGNDAVVKKEASNCNNYQIKSGPQWNKMSNDDLVRSRQRIKAPARQNHLSSGNAVVTGQSKNDTRSGKCVDSNSGGLTVNTMKPTKAPLSPIPARDVHHILSILKKPVAQDNLSTLEKAAIKHPSEFVLEPYEVATEVVTNECERDEVEERKSTETGCTGVHPSPKTAGDNSVATSQANTECSSNNIERSVSKQGMTFESPNIIQTEPVNNVQASVNHEQSIPGYMETAEETRSTPQSYAKLPETNVSSKERTSLFSNKPKGRRLFSGLAGMKRSYTDTQSSLGNLDCPSFDLGI